MTETQKIYYKIMCFCTAMLFLCTARAEEKSYHLSLDQTQLIALRENKSILVARFLIQVAKTRLRQSGLWPNPELELTRTNDSTFNDEGEYSASVGFNQKFPLSGRLSKVKTLARVDVALALAEVRNEERLLLGQVLKEARSLLVVEQNIKTNAESMTIIRNLISLSEKRLKQAEISPTDINIEKIELQKLEAKASSLEIKRERLRASLNILLGRPPGEELEIIDTLDHSKAMSNLSPSLELALLLRPDRQMALLQIDRTSAEKMLAKAQRFEDWSIGFGYERDISKFDSNTVSDKTDEFLGFRLSIPLPLWNQNQGKIDEARISRSRAKAYLSALDLNISEEIETTHATVLKLGALIKQYEEQSLKLAEENLELLNKSYSDGLAPISAVIQGQQQMVEVRENYTETLKEFWRSLTELEIVTASNPFLQSVTP